MNFFLSSVCKYEFLTKAKKSSQHVTNHDLSSLKFEIFHISWFAAAPFLWVENILQKYSTCKISHFEILKQTNLFFPDSYSCFWLSLHISWELPGKRHHRFNNSKKMVLPLWFQSLLSRDLHTLKYFHQTEQWITTVFTNI